MTAVRLGAMNPRVNMLRPLPRLISCTHLLGLRRTPGCTLARVADKAGVGGKEPLGRDSDMVPAEADADAAADAKAQPEVTEALADGNAGNGQGESVAPVAQAASTGAVQAEEKKGLPHRWQVVFMMGVAFVLCNMDKVNMSVAIIPMAQELGWSALDRGLVSSSFFWGYTLTQMPGGYISTKIGGARVLMAGVALWSLGTLIAPPAARISIWALCATRLLVGLGEGVAPSAATTVLAKLMPASERSRAVSVVWGGLDVGSVVGLLLSGPLIKAYGWPSVFYLYGLLGLVWAFFWRKVRPDEVPPADSLDKPTDPTASKASSPENAAPAKDVPVPWGEFFRSMPVLAVTVAHFCFNWGYYVLLSWLPSYFELALGLNVQKSSVLTLIPYLAMTAMMPLVGPVADSLVEKGWPVTKVRKLAQGTALVGPAACMIACGQLTPVAGATASAAAAAPVMLIVAILSLSFALGAWSRAGLYCNHQDLSPKYAGALLGITNTAGALPGVLAVTSAGYLLDVTGSWALALFYPTAVCQIFGAIFYTMFASSERQNWS